MQNFYSNHTTKKYTMIEINDAEFKDLPKINSAFMKNNTDDFESHLKSLLDKIIYFAHEVELTQLNLANSNKSTREELMDLNQNIKLLIHALNEGSELLNPNYTFEHNVQKIFSNVDNICTKMNIKL